MLRLLESGNAQAARSRFKGPVRLEISVSAPTELRPRAGALWEDGSLGVESRSARSVSLAPGLPRARRSVGTVPTEIPFQVSDSQTIFRPRIRRDYPLNLSILISGGKETNKDSLSNGE